MRDRFKPIMAAGLLAFGAMVVAYSAWVEPSGELHGSILTFFGEALTGVLVLVGLRPPKK